MRLIRLVLVSLLVMAIGVVGCTRGPAPPKRGPLSGKVTLNGKPLASGQIRLMAFDPGAVNIVATISDGQYSVPAVQGPMKGRYRVEFSVPAATKRRIPNDDVPGEFIEEAPETLPPRYHRESQLSLDYDPDQPQPHDFRLTTP